MKISLNWFHICWLKFNKLNFFPSKCYDRAEISVRLVLVDEAAGFPLCLHCRTGARVPTQVASLP